MAESELNLGLDAEPPLKRELGPALAELRQTGVWIGTSSWKYPGWVGQLYSAARYRTRGKLSESKFKQGCLREYAETFSTVCVDAAFYQFPTEEQIDALALEVPTVFKFAFKVTDQLTVPVWPRHPRHGKEAGSPNPHFLCAETFCRRYLHTVERLADRLGVLIFEFSPISRQAVHSAKDFTERLDVFFSQLPARARYAVEVRNREFLNPGYFEVLRRHGVAHCFNSWTRMPPVSEQLAMPGVFTANFIVSRFLLKPGRSYEEAVERFKPYDRLGEIYEDGRSAARTLIAQARKLGKPVFSFFNNRFEGNAPATIRAVIGGQLRPPKR